MKKYFQILSAVLSIVITGSVVGPSVYADEDSSVNYNTFSVESKDLERKSDSAKKSASSREVACSTGDAKIGCKVFNSSRRAFSSAVSFIA